MAVVKVYNKERDVTYVYDSYSYWDKEKKQPRSKRKLIGKLDPITGEIVPTGKRGRPKTSPANSDTKLSANEQSVFNSNADLVNDLRNEIAALKRENQRLLKIIDKASAALADAR